MERLRNICKGSLPVAVKAKVLVRGLQNLLTAFVVRRPPLPDDPGRVDHDLLRHSLNNNLRFRLTQGY